MPLFIFGQEKAPKITPKPRPQDLQEHKPDFSRESLFKGLFSAGFNLSQVEGDLEDGYRQFGAQVGVGTLVKFHKYLSTSLEILYSMQGAGPRYKTFNNGQRNFYRLDADYIQLPLSLNVHDKGIVMAGIGVSFGALVRYKEAAIDTLNRNITDFNKGTPIKTTYGVEYPYEPLRKFDISVHAHAEFIIKKQFCIGIRFLYSMLRTRDAFDQSKIKGQYNNVLTIRLAYILDPKRMKLQKRR